jgi:hypothetical protein
VDGFFNIYTYFKEEITLLKLHYGLKLAQGILKRVLKDDRLTEIEGDIRAFNNWGEQGFQIVIEDPGFKQRSRVIAFSNSKNSEHIKIYQGHLSKEVMPENVFSCQFAETEIENAVEFIINAAVQIHSDFNRKEVHPEEFLKLHKMLLEYLDNKGYLVVVPDGKLNLVEVSDSPANVVRIEMIAEVNEAQRISNEEEGQPGNYVVRGQIKTQFSKTSTTDEAFANRVIKDYQYFMEQ